MNKKSLAVSTSHQLVNSLFDGILYKSIDFNGLTIRQLKKIIVYNKKPDCGSIIFDSIKMPKSQLVTEMNKIKNKLLIPADL